MSIDISSARAMYDEISGHVGHDITCVSYGDGANVALQCETCGCILVGADRDPEELEVAARQDMVTPDGTLVVLVAFRDTFRVEVQVTPAGAHSDGVRAYSADTILGIVNGEAIPAVYCPTCGEPMANGIHIDTGAEGCE